jgi:hypothetical protein
MSTRPKKQTELTPTVPGRSSVRGRDRPLVTARARAAAVSAVAINTTLALRLATIKFIAKGGRERALNVLRGHSADSRCQGWIVSRAK